MARAKILVVEDENIIAQGLKDLLSSMGYSVVGPVPSGEEAVEWAEKATPDLILMDVVLGGKMDGIEAALYIRNQLNIPAIFLTARSDEKTLARAREAAPYSYILKPFEGRELRAAIEIALYRRSAEELERQQITNLEFLSQSAARFVQMTQEDDFYTFIGEQVSKLAPGGVITVNSIDEAVRSTTVRCIYGPADFKESIFRRSGSEPGGLTLPISPSQEAELSTGRLLRIPQPPPADQPVPAHAEGKHESGDTYAIGFNRDGRLFGSVMILIRPGEKLDNVEVIETFVNLAAVALQRLRAEQVRQQSEEDYRSIFENAHDAILLLDQDCSSILEFNRHASETYGYSQDELTHLPFEYLVGDIARIRPKLVEVLQTAEAVDFDTVQYRKDGSELFVRVNATPIHYQGRPAVLCLNRDYTAHKLAEARLEVNARRLAALSRMGQLVTASLELGEVLQRVTGEARILMGVDTVSILLEENEGELTFVAVSEDLEGKLRGLRIPASVGAAGEVMKTGKAVLINRETQQDRIYRDVDEVTGFQTRSLLAVPLILNGDVIGVVEAVYNQLGVFTMDDQNTLEGVANWAAIAIANARQYATIQQRLQESEAIAEIGRTLLGTLNLEQVLQMIADSAQELIPNVERAVIHLVDEQNNTLDMAAATGIENLEGPFFTIRPGEGVAGKVLAEGKTINVANTQTDPSYLPLGARSRIGSLLVAPIQSGSNLLGTLSVRSASTGAFSVDDERLLTILGVQAALAIKNARLFQAEQKSRRLAETLLEHEKSTRAQLVQSEKLAALGRIVASVAHELNNPLQAIHNAIYLVQMEAGLNPQTQEDLKVALNESHRMADLIARLRETYRPATSEEFHPEELNALVVEVQKLLSTHMRHQEIEFRFEPDPDLAAIPLIRDQIRQVILNICLNGIESMPAGGRLTIRTSSQGANRDEALISFHDTGPGIPVDILPNIFDPFFTTKDGGTGLGLAITYDIVQRHKGRIEVESDPNNGTTFKIWLPAGQSKRKASRAQAAFRDRGQSSIPEAEEHA